ncbi:MULTISPECIES: group II intron maturase-specific domain-containing protein [unclassified Moorena]|uniref:group II intron reverse transcriptase n=1 Tax=unclassified Moorena TaxID=2683338 RepID=UPI0025F13BAB|nr:MULTISPECIES: group II intron maturase-specific domain-containing protein [unclassified Moorena]
MEERIKRYAESLPGRKVANRQALNIVRYADDFVIMHKNPSVIEECQKIIGKWLSDIGLELKPSKTKIVHTMEGFDFLGFNIRQYKVGKTHSKQGFKTIIKPSQKSIKEHYERLASIIHKHKAAPQEALIRHLRPIIRGWCNYYSAVCSKRTYSKIDNMLWNKLQRWGYRRHSKKSKAWVNKKYWGTKVETPKKPWDAPKVDNWVFMVYEDNFLQKHTKTKIIRHKKVQDNRSPFDGDLVYWSARMQKHPEMTSQKGRLLKRQEGKCTHCGLTFRSEDQIEKHHIIPRSNGGSNLDKNLELLHLHCHDAKHGKKIDTSELDENPF